MLKRLNVLETGNAGAVAPAEAERMRAIRALFSYARWFVGVNAGRSRDVPHPTDEERPSWGYSESQL